MITNKLLYYLANFTLQHSFEKIIIKLTEKEKKLIIFDVGCYRGIFTKTIFKLIYDITFGGIQFNKIFVGAFPAFNSSKSDK